MMLVADHAADPRGAVARGDVKKLPRYMRPSVVHIGRQGDGAAFASVALSTSTS